MTSVREFTFHYIPSRKFSSLSSNDSQNVLMQWSMKGRIHCQCYSFDETFKSYDIDKFASAFFSDNQVRGTINSAEGVPYEGLEVEVTPVPCSLLTMDIFNRCIGTVTHPTGRIKSCLDEYFGPFIVNDELKMMLLVKDSGNYELFSEEERDEFLFRLFKHIVIGGELVQPSDEIKVYLDFVRTLYKDLISVQKVADTDELIVSSLVYEVKVRSNNQWVYPSGQDNPNTFAYLIINPTKRHVTVLSHVFGVGSM